MYRLALFFIGLAGLSGCSTYNIASTTSYITTGKGIPDHSASLVTGADCNLIKHLWNNQYICEVTPIYNQNPL